MCTSVLIFGCRIGVKDDPARSLPSGRAAIFRILVRQILEENPQLQATVVAETREALHVPRSLRRRVGFELADSSKSYAKLIPAITHLRAGLLVVDQLTPDNAPVIMEAAQNGIWIISQMDTVFHGSEVLQGLLEWGLPRSCLNGSRWVVAVQRLPMLCECKKPMQPDTSIIEAIQRRYPHLKISEGNYHAAGSCSNCEHTGRHNRPLAKVIV